MRFTKSEAKDWAKEHFVGLDAIMMPSFDSETLALDEPGIRHDVRMMIEHGFFGVSLIEHAMTIEEEKLFLEWCIDEAKGRIGVTVPLHFATLEEQVEMARFAESVGCEVALLRYPPNFRPGSLEQLYDYNKAICEATNMAVVLFPTIRGDVPLLGQTPPSFLARLAQLDNVVAMKIGVFDLTWMDECFRTFGDRVLISYPFDDGWSIFIPKYGQQWAGSGLYQIMQTPDDPREVRLFNLIRDGRMDEAMALYWHMNPLRICHTLEIQQTHAAVGMYHIQAWKYEASLLGMTGGVIREPRLRLTQQHQDMFRDAMIASGLKVVC